MKRLNYSTIKRNILLLFVLLLLCCYICNIIEYHEKKIFIANCIKLCYKDINEYMEQETSIRYFGYYNVKMGEEEKFILSKFYESNITNKEHIMQYLITVNWNNIILINKGNIANILLYIREDYVTYLRMQEISYTKELLKNTNIIELKNVAVNVLQTYGQNMGLNPLQKMIAISDNYINDIIKQVDWFNYIKTAECQNKTFTTLIKYYHDKTQQPPLNYYTIYFGVKMMLAIPSIINTIRFYHNYYVIFKKINDINGLITLAFSLAKQIRIEKLSKNELINLLSKLFK